MLELVTNPVTTFGDAGTLAAFGFLLAYFLITIAAPVYLHRRGELRARHVVIAVIACLCLLVPTEGSFYPVPPFPVNIFPYLFAAYIAVGGGVAVHPQPPSPRHPGRDRGRPRADPRSPRTARRRHPLR